MKREGNKRPKPTAEQRAAIEHLGSPLLVLAGPGTGKTTVLALRVLFLLERRIVKENQILAVTFTTKAAKEMRDRLIEYGLPENKHPWIGTLHAVAARILHENPQAVGLPNDFFIADSGESRLASNDACAWTAGRLDLDFRSLARVFPKLRSSRYKGLMASEVTTEPLRSLFARYEDMLRFYRASDFDGLLLHALAILRLKNDVRAKYQSKAKILLVDEYQDINGAQHQLLRLLGSNQDGVFAVGDDDQSIYSWRGGSPQLILDFDKSFAGAKRIMLTLSQRCPGYVLTGALGVIANNKTRFKKNIKPCGSKGKLIRILYSKSENAEAKWIADWIKENVDGRVYNPSDITILSTDPTIADLAYTEVLKRGVKAIRKAETPLNSVLVRRIVSLMRVIIDSSDDLAVRRSLEEGPIKGFGPKAIGTIISVAERKSCSMWDVLLSPERNGLSRWKKAVGEFVTCVRRLRKICKSQALPRFLKYLVSFVGTTGDEKVTWLLKRATDMPKGTSLEKFLENLRAQVPLDVTEEVSDEQIKGAVSFLTTYLVKGLEAKVVFVIGLEENLFPDSTKDIEEQRRLFYVAMTRAKSELFLCTAKMRKVRGFRFYRPSPFISEIPSECTRAVENT